MILRLLLTCWGFVFSTHLVPGFVCPLPLALALGLGFAALDFILRPLGGMLKKAFPALVVFLLFVCLRAMLILFLDRLFDLRLLLTPIGAAVVALIDSVQRAVLYTIFFGRN